MKIDVRPGDQFGCIAGVLAQHRDDAGRLIDIDMCYRWHKAGKSAFSPIPRDKAFAIIRAYGHEVVEEPERFPRPTHAVVTSDGLVTYLGSEERCRSTFRQHTIVPIGHWWEGGR